MLCLTPEETEIAVGKLTAEEREVLQTVEREGDLCAHQMSDAERKIASRLVRRGLINSERGRVRIQRGEDGCDVQHYF